MVNQGNGKGFVNKSTELGTHFFAISWGANFGDFDQDGDLDLFVANGDLNPYCVAMADFYFVNTGNHFEDKARQAGLNDYGIGRGSVMFDYDNDGDQDLLVVNQEPVLTYPVPSVTHLYRNDSATGNWIKISLKGIQAESHGIGSKIEIEAGGKKMIREIDGGGSSHISQNSVIAHFGLGKISKIDKITVYWTGGNKQSIINVAANQSITISEIPREKWNYNLIYIIVGLIAVAAGVIYWWNVKSKP